MKKLKIVRNTKIAKMQAVNEIANGDAVLEFRPQPVVVRGEDEITFMGIDFAAQLAGKKFDEIEVDPPVAKGLKSVQKGFLQTLKK